MMFDRREFLKKSISIIFIKLLPFLVGGCRKSHGPVIRVEDPPSVKIDDLTQGNIKQEELEKVTSTYPDSCHRKNDFRVPIRNITPSRWRLIAQETYASFFDDDSKKPVAVWSFVRNSLPCPIILNQNQPTTIEVTNQLNSQKMGIHWYGVPVPNHMDGVPGITQPPIGYQASHTYSYLSRYAGTFLYRTHSDPKQPSPTQLGMGLIGALIVKEEKPYPVDLDQIIFLKDWRLNSNQSIDQDFSDTFDLTQGGRLGNYISVNGKVSPSLPFPPGSRVRLRMINASEARIYALDFNPDLKIFIIARDGHPIKPVRYRPAYLGPGMRLDLVLDLPSKEGVFQVTDRFHLRAPILKIVVRGRPITSKQHLPIPHLSPNPVRQPVINQAKQHTLYLSGGAMMPSLSSGLNWSITSQKALGKNESSQPIFFFKLNQSYRVRLINRTLFSHTIHFHGHTFKVFHFNDRNLAKPFFSDTVLLKQNETAEIALVADNPGKWLIDCQIAGHRVSGRSRFFEVR